MAASQKEKEKMEELCGSFLRELEKSECDSGIFFVMHNHSITMSVQVISGETKDEVNGNFIEILRGAQASINNILVRDGLDSDVTENLSNVVIKRTDNDKKDGTLH